MSERSLRRAQQRRIDRERRRAAQLRGRAGLAAGAAVGIALLGPGTAQAANFVVNTLADHPADACEPVGTGDCTLRDALAAATANGGTESDTIGFSNGATGTLRLTEGELVVPSGAGNVLVQGPGAANLTITGDEDADGTGDSRLFHIASTGIVTLSNMTLTEGNGAGAAQSGAGGAILSTGEGIVVQNSIVTGNTADRGGAIAAANPADAAKYAVDLSDTTITSNSVSGDGGAIDASSGIRLDRSTLSDNSAGDDGGAVNQTGMYQALIATASDLTGNQAADGGAIALAPTGDGTTSAPISITNTRVAANAAATGDGGGLVVTGSSPQHVRITGSTFSGNVAAGAGGGIAVRGGVPRFTLTNSTLSGNGAPTGGGLAVGTASQPATAQDNATVRQSTIAGNGGGGITLATSASGAMKLEGVIVADNDGGTDVARTAGPGGATFALSAGLVEAPGAGVTPDTDSLTGQDPKLGPLQDNGGRTRTHLPAADSPVIDQSKAFTTSVDQRGFRRTADEAPPNAATGDGTDMGSVERDTVAPAITTIRRISPTNERVPGDQPVAFEIRFDEPVTGVGADDLVLTTTGAIAGAAITNVSDGSNTRVVNVAVGTGEGTIRLDVKGGATIADLSGNALTGPYTTGESFTVDRTPPTPTVTRKDASPTAAGEVAWEVDFGEPVHDVDLTDFALTADGPQGAALTGITGDDGDAEYTVTADAGSGEGALRLDVLDDDTIRDAAGNGLPAPLTTGPAYTIDRTAPSLALNQAAGQADPSQDDVVRFTVTADEPITGLTPSDLVVGGSAGATKATLGGSGLSFTVSVSGMLRAGTITAALPAGTVTDLAGNPSGAAAVSSDASVSWSPKPPPASPPAAPPQGQAPPPVPPQPSITLTCRRVPKLTGKTLRQARRLLVRAGCTTRVVVKKPKGVAETRLVVTRQTPKAGLSRQGAQTVKLTVKRRAVKRRRKG